MPSVGELIGSVGVALEWSGLIVAVAVPWIVGVVAIIGLAIAIYREGW